MKPLLLILLLLCASVARAEPDPRLAALEAAYNRVQQEQQAMYQQFQMTQELRRNELQEVSPNLMRNYSMTQADNTQPIDYDENVRQQRARQERLQRYEREINQAYARFVELGNQKRLLLDQIIELSQPPRR